MSDLDKEFVQKIESQYFRTDKDTGAGLNTILVWNQVRRHVGLEGITWEDLPAWCQTHKKYHKIIEDYDCKR